MLLDLIDFSKLRRAIIYALMMLVLFVLQDLLISRIALFGVRAMLIPAAVVAIGLFDGGLWGGFTGLFAGYFMDMGYSENVILFMLLFAAAGFFAAAKAPRSHLTNACQSFCRFAGRLSESTQRAGTSPSPSESPLKRMAWTSPQPVENQTALRKFRSAKCCAARRPIASWSDVTRGTLTSGRDIVRSTTGIPRFMRREMQANVTGSERIVAITPSPSQARGW